MQYSLEIITGSLIILSVLSLTLILERLWSIVYKIKTLDRAVEEQLLEYLFHKEYDDAASLCRLQTHPAFQVVLKLLEHLLSHKTKTGKDLKDVANEAILEQTHLLEKFVPPLGTISTVAPSLGLLGTVTGMIKSFSAFEQGASRSAELFGGIDEALITTAIGLVIAIPALVMYNYFVRRIANVINETNILSEIVLKNFQKIPENKKIARK